MTPLLIAVSLAALVALPPSASPARDPRYDAPLQPVDFTASAIVLARKAIGESVIRKKSAIAVEIDVRVEDFVPRDLAPTLVINGKPQRVDSGVRGVDGSQTILGFVVDRPELLPEGAVLALQWEERTETRARVPGVLRRRSIKALPPKVARASGVPSLSDWFARAEAPAK